MEHDIAVQSVVFGDADFETVLDALATTPVSKVELWSHHLPPSTDSAAVRDAKDRLDGIGVEVIGYGVVEVDGSKPADDAFATAAELGADYVTVSFDPTAEDIGTVLTDAAETHDLDVALHNYSTLHHDEAGVFSAVDEVEAFLADHQHPRLGVCIDTGHFLVMDEGPEAAIAELGEHVSVVHLKDMNDATEDAPGRGVLSLPSLVDRLAQNTDPSVPVVIEFELTPDAVESALEETYDRLNAV